MFIVFTSVFIDVVDKQLTEEATAVVIVVVIVTEEQQANDVVTVDWL